MGWERLNRERLAKVLALAASNRDGEALSALRKANGMLNTVGLDLGDLARRFDPGAAPSPAPEEGPKPAAATQERAERPESRSAEVQMLLRQISELHGRVARAEAESAFQRAEAQHWHDLTIEAARYVCMLEDELFAIRRALESADLEALKQAAAVLNGAGRADRDRSGAAAGGALGERIAQFAAWQRSLAKSQPPH